MGQTKASPSLTNQRSTSKKEHLNNGKDRQVLVNALSLDRPILF
jgi:hypothetical protein